MNWYFEVQGVSKGPFPEDELVQMTQRGDVPADSMIWRPGLDEWGSIRELKPSWLSDAASPRAAARPPKTQTAPEKKTKHAAPPKAAAPPAAEDLPVIEAAVPTEPANPAHAPVQSKLKPQAPTPEEVPAPAPAKGGLLKRMFGLGGKKK